jgi:predicted naringenin-chalcone synthase
MTFVAAVTTDSPPFRYDTADIRRAAEKWLKVSPEHQSLFERLTASTQIESRAFALPVEQVLSLNGPSERSAVFERAGTSLLESVVRSALENSGYAPRDVAAFLFTSCSVPAIPSIDVKVVERVGLSPATVRLPIFQHGCAGGAVGLSLAHQLAPSSGITLLASVELCSLVYQSRDLTGVSIPPFFKHTLLKQ